MTQEQFFDLARRVSDHARTHPRRYRIKVALLAALGYTVLFGLMAVCAGLLVAGCLAFTQPWFWETAGRDFRIVILAGALVLSFATALFAMVRSLFVKIPIPAGRRIQRDDAPELFATIDEVVAASQAPRPHAVLLTWDFNASVSQRPRFGWFGRTRDYLVLGVPLMAALTPPQFKAVLAHEFGHLRGGHGRFANWAYRLRSIWDQTLERLARRRQKIVVLIVVFLRWYAPRFSAYTYALARVQEFEADRWAAQVAGLPAAGEALVNIWTRGAQVREQFWRPLNQRACQEAEVPGGVFTPMLALLRQPVARADQRRWLRRALSEVTDGTDTHPAPAERLASLELPSTAEALDSDEMWSDETPGADVEATGEPSAAEALLGSRLGEFLSELETSWRTLTAPTWRQRFERAGAARTRLAELAREEGSTPGGELPEGAAWERARLELDLAGTPTETRAVAERFTTRWPGHALGQLVLGQLLLDEDDETGLGHVEEAMRLNSRFSADGEEAIAAYLRRSGQAEAAETRRRAAVRHVDVLDAARTERQTVTRKDRFLPHGLSEAELAAIRAQLSKHPRVCKAWLARKVVKHHSDQPWYVLICLFKWRWNEAGTQVKLQGLLNEILQGLSVAGTNEFYFSLVNIRHRNNPVLRRVRKTVGAQVFPAPVPKGRRWWRGGRVPAPVVPAGPVAPVLSAAATRLPDAPPLPVLPMHVPIPVGAFSRKVGAGPVLVALLVVTMPLAIAAWMVFHSHGTWQQLRTVLQRTVGRGRRPNGMLAEARKPIQRDPQATTQETDCRLSIAWARRTMLGGYDHAGHHNSHWNTEARGFIEHALPLWADLLDSPVTAADLVPEARKVLQLGCDDPLVLYLAGIVEQRADRQSPVAGPLLARAVAGFAHTPYPRGVALYAAGEMVADCARRRDGTGQDKPAREAWLRWFGQALGGSFGPDEQTVLAWHLARGDGSSLFEANRDECMNLVGNAPPGAVAPWLRGWLSGKRYLEDAWQSRGSGYASEVTSEGWHGFERGLALARRDLTASWQANPRRPEAAGLMITVAMGLNATGADGPRAWFDRSVRAQVDYVPAYDRFYTTLLPQWGGSVAAIQSFGLACAATADYHTEVPMILNRMVRRLEFADGYGNPTMYMALERMFAGYEAGPLAPRRRIYLYGWHARAAVQTRRYAQAYQLLKEVNYTIAPEIAEMLAEQRESASYLERIAAYGGPGGPDALAGEELLRCGRNDAALQRFHSALAAAGTDPRAAAWLQGRLDKLETESRLAAGDWISVQPKSGTSGAPVGWTSKLGTWRVAADGSLVGQAGASGLMLVSDTRVGGNFEISGELDFLPGAPGEEQSGVLFGHPDMENDDWQSFRLKRNGPDGSIATISCNWYDGPKQPVTVPNHNTFTLQSWHGYLTLTVNGEVMFRHQKLDKGQVSDGTGLVGLGGYSHHGSTYTVAYRQLQLRRLTRAPLDGDGPAPSAPNDAAAAKIAAH